MVVVNLSNQNIHKEKRSLMSNQFREKLTITRREFLKILGIFFAWIIIGVKSVAHVARQLAGKFLERIQAAYARDSAMSLRKSQDNPQVQSLYTNFLGEPLSELSESLLHTSYVDRSGAITAICQKPMRTMPESLAIIAVYPNPFNATTEIAFRLAGSEMVWLAVFNTAGQQVCSLIEKIILAGTHRVRWDGRDKYGKRVASGLYIARLVSGSQMASQRMTLTK